MRPDHWDFNPFTAGREREKLLYPLGPCFMSITCSISSDWLTQVSSESATVPMCQRLILRLTHTAGKGRVVKWSAGIEINACCFINKIFFHTSLVNKSEIAAAIWCKKHAQNIKGNRVCFSFHANGSRWVNYNASNWWSSFISEAWTFKTLIKFIATSVPLRWTNYSWIVFLSYLWQHSLHPEQKKK